MKDYISQARLDTYKNILKLKDEENILRAYYWSKALSASIYPIMQTLEITFRNALNLAVKSNHNGKYANDDWWLEHIATTIQDMKIKKMSPTNKKKWLNPDGSRKKQSFAEQQILKVIHDLKK